MRRFVWILGFITLVALPTVALAAASPKRVRVTNCSKSEYKPKLIVISCGDASNYVAKLKWSSWSRSRATGKGVDEVNSCQPNCASGHEIGTTAQVTLSDPRRCKGLGRRVFDRMKLTFAGQRGSQGSQGSGSTQRIVLGCPIE